MYRALPFGLQFTRINRNALLNQAELHFISQEQFAGEAPQIVDRLLHFAI
ncbi:hypothetical protein KPZU09_17800 [Klebsiella pneumoniae]|uniref:Uncharacterized protein n=1 Tax=Klebsiella pneumoniae TaxID=573 RepID=A0A919HNZ6_KLEPN|nr:hypothetical protein KPZU09_17800 [Klebsiella pneumoniae]